MTMRLGIRWEHGLSAGAVSRRDSRISGGDAIQLLEVIQECLSAGTEESIREKVYPGIQKLFPFDFAGAELGGYIGPGGSLAIKNYFHISMPTEFCAEYVRQNLFPLDAAAAYHFANFEPQYWSVTEHGVQESSESSRKVLSLCMDFGMNGGYSHGCEMRAPGAGGSICGFLGKATKFDSRTFEILEHLMPHLHLALLRVADQEPKSSSKDVLSSREQEVLSWLKEGKSSWDISVVLGVSERTINFHVYNLLRKLGALNRPQAVAIAARRGLIALD